MRHYRSRALILCPVSCVVSRETAILLRFHGVLGTEVAWGRAAVRGFERAGALNTGKHALSFAAEDGPPCEAPDSVGEGSQGRGGA